MITYQCPRCGATQGVLITPTAPVTCSGMKRNEDNRFKPTHSSAVCVILTEGGETKPQPKPTNTKEKKTIMSKEASNVCACYSEVVKGDVHVTCGRLCKGKFAPGHDAKLKGMLIRAAAAGETFKFSDDGGKTVQTADPAKQADKFGSKPGWGALITKGMAVAQAKADAPKRERKAAAPKAGGVTKVDRGELIARAAAKKAAKDAAPVVGGQPKATSAKAANAKKSAAAKAASLV